MTRTHGTPIAAVAAAFVLALPGSALAAHHRRHHVRSTVSVPQPTIVVPHKFDAGGDGGEATMPPGLKVSLFDPVLIAQTLGNDLLAQLGLPPVS